MLYAKIKPYVTPLLILLISFFLRLSLISKGPYHGDCMRLAMQSQETLSTHKLYFLHGHGYPLTVILGVVFTFLAHLCSNNDPVFAVNFMSVLLSSFSILIMYYIVKKLFGNAAAIISAFLLCVNPIFLATSVYGNSHAPFVFFFLGGLLAFVHYLKTPRLSLCILSGLLFGCAGASRIQDLALVITPLSILFFIGLPPQTTVIQPINKIQRLKKYACFMGVVFFTVFLFYTPLLIKIFTNPNTYTHITGFYSHRLLKLFSTNFFISLKYFVHISSFTGFLCLCLGLFLLYQDNRKLFWFLLLGIILPIPIVGHWDTFVPRFLTVSILFSTLVQGYFFSWLIKRPNIFRFSAVALFVIIICGSLDMIGPTLYFRHVHALLPSFARWVSTKTEPTSVIICLEEHRFIQYYSHRSTIYRPSYKAKVTKEHIQIMKRKIEATLQNKTPIYITGSGLKGSDINSTFYNFIKTNYSLTWIGEHASEGWQMGTLVKWVGKEVLYKIDTK